MAQDALTKVLPIVPAHVPGFGMAELIKHLSKTVRSSSVLSTDTTVVNLFEIPGNILVESLMVNVTTAFDASGTSARCTATITVPGDTGAVVLWDADSLDLQTLSSDFMYPSTNTGPVKIAASGGFVILNYTPNTTQAGALEVYMKYLPDINNL